MKKSNVYLIIIFLFLLNLTAKTETTDINKKLDVLLKNKVLLINNLIKKNVLN